MNTSEMQKPEQALLELMQDIRCLEKLRPWTDRINIFHVLKIARTEIRHSNMLAWLLDPNENHGLGSDFLQAFITDLSKPHTYEFASDYYDPIIKPPAAINLLSSNLKNSQVFREWNHIDVLLKLPKDYIIAFENKVDAVESSKSGKSQLEYYTEALERNFVEADKIIKVFLTPDGNKPSEKNNEWRVYTYSDILSILQSVYELHEDSLSDEANILIKNYIGILDNEIMENYELKDLCNEIYQKHKQAFDLIFENRESVTSMASLLCYKLLEPKDKIELLNKKAGVYNKFTTEKSRQLENSLKGEMQDPPIDVYYQFEFRPSGDYGVKATLTLVLHNKSKKFDANIKKIVNKYAEKNKIDGEKNWEWKGIWSTKPKQFKEIRDEEIRKWIESSLEQLEKYENEFNFDKSAAIPQMESVSEQNRD